MRKLSFWLLPLPLLFLVASVFAQAACDTARASAILAQAHKTFLGEQFREAPELALSALPLLENCDHAKSARFDILLQAASWQTELEDFEKATKSLQSALDLAESDGQKARLYCTWAEMEISARQYEQAKAHLDMAKTRSPNETLALRLSLQEASILIELNHTAEALTILEGIKSRFEAGAAVEEHLRLQCYTSHIAALASAGRYAAVFEVADNYLALSEKASPENFGEHIELLLLVVNSAYASNAFRKTAPAYYDKLTLALATSLPFVRQRFEPFVTSTQIVIYTSQFQGQKALATFNHVLTQIDKTRMSHRVAEAKAYQNVANAYVGMDMNLKCVEMSRVSNALLEQIPNPNQRTIGFNYFRVGQSYRGMGELDLALPYLEKSLEIMKKILVPESQLPYYEQLLRLYGEKKDKPNTLRYLQQYQSIITESPNAADLDKFLLGKWWFFYHQEFGSLDTAVVYAEAVLRDYGPKVSNFYSKELELRLSHAYVHLGAYQKSFDLAKKLADYFEQRRAKLGEAYGTEHYSWMLAVSALSAWKLYENNGDTSMRRLALTQCLKSENALYSLRRQKKENQEIRLITDTYLYSGLVNLRQKFYQETGDWSNVAKAFELGEMSRMARFQERLNTANAIQFGDLSPEASQQERDLLAQISNIKIEQDKLYFQSGPQKDSLENALATKLSEHKRNYNLLLSSFEGQFPSYYRLKYDLSHLDLATVQQKVLKRNETLLCYYYYADEMGIMAVRKDSVLFKTIPMANRTLEQVDSLKVWFANFPFSKDLPEAKYVAHQANLAAALQECYENLVAPVAPFLTSEVLVQPSDLLVYLPFEALLSSRATNLARPATWAYLGNEKNISYIQSATVFDAVQRRKPLQEPKNQVYSFAPFFDGDTALFAGLDYTRRVKADYYSPLPHTGEEAIAVANLLNGKAFVGKDASVQEFSKRAVDCKILHAATHASGGDGDLAPSFLALQAEKGAGKNSLLFTDQIYQLQLNADLVTLSACESGLGWYSQNEGLEGLTRAFTCAGARNVIASLWSVNDASTQKLMVLFYKEVNKGLSYNQALANAKRAFVKENRQYAHPYYWAGFVLNGR